MTSRKREGLTRAKAAFDRDHQLSIPAEFGEDPKCFSQDIFLPSLMYPAVQSVSYIWVLPYVTRAGGETAIWHREVAILSHFFPQIYKPDLSCLCLPRSLHGACTARRDACDPDLFFVLPLHTRDAGRVRRSQETGIGEWSIHNGDCWDTNLTLPCRAGEDQ